MTCSAGGIINLFQLEWKICMSGREIIGDDWEGLRGEENLMSSEPNKWKNSRRAGKAVINEFFTNFDGDNSDWRWQGFCFDEGI
jgi:hypothetical protein